jgi:hypothetical protein
MIGLYIFAPLVLAVLVKLIVYKVTWSRQSFHKWATVTASSNVLK